MVNEKKYQPVQVQVDTKIDQSGETETHHFVETGQLAEINGATYLRYQEHLNGQVTPVTFKLIDDNHVRLTRKSVNELKFEFTEGEKTGSQYQTPYGKMKIDVLAQKVNVKLGQLKTSGSIEVTYSLYTGPEKVGDYQIKLQFGL